MRNKFMSDEEAKAILQHSGLPVELPTGSRPQWMNNLPSARVYGSGINSSGTNWLGIEVYRDSKDHPEAISGYIYNQDRYSGLSTSSGYIPTGLPLGPDHWATGIPQHLLNAPVIDPENKTE